MVLDKKSLRKKIMKMRLDMSEKQYHDLSHFIIDELKNREEFQQAKTIAVYLSYHHEVDTWELVQEMIKMKTICVPVIKDHHQMDFVEIQDLKSLKKNKYGIAEPCKGKVIDKNDIDVMIVPLVGYNNDNYRLGYGGGYYDRYLIDYHGKTIGLAFTFQKIEDYIPEEHDMPLDVILTK